MHEFIMTSSLYVFTLTYFFTQRESCLLGLLSPNMSFFVYSAFIFIFTTTCMRPASEGGGGGRKKSGLITSCGGEIGVNSRARRNYVCEYSCNYSNSTPVDAFTCSDFRDYPIFHPFCTTPKLKFEFEYRVNNGIVFLIKPMNLTYTNHNYPILKISKKEL